MHHWPPRLELAASDGLTWACCEHDHLSTHKETRPNPNAPSNSASASAWQLAIKGTPALGHSLRSAPGARGEAAVIGHSVQAPRPDPSSEGGPPRDRWQTLPSRLESHRPEDSVVPKIATAHSISTCTLRLTPPGDAPTPRLPNHCPVKGPELNYLGTPSSRLSRRDSVESLQRDYPDIIAHASSPE